MISPVLWKRWRWQVKWLPIFGSQYYSLYSVYSNWYFRGDNTIYATWNDLDRSPNHTLSGGNLQVTATNTAWKSQRATIGKSSGKWYFEVIIDWPGSFNAMVWVATASESLSNFVGFWPTWYSYYSYTGKSDPANAYNNNVNFSYGTVFNKWDVIGVALNMDSGQVTFYKNNVSQGTMSGLSGTMYPMVSLYDTWLSAKANFGASKMAYTAPVGFNQGLYAPDVYTANPTDTISLTESIAYDVSANYSDTISLTESRLYDLTRELSDTLVATDNIAASIGYSSLVQDTATLSDTLSTLIGLVATIQDTLNVSESIALVLALNILLSDTVTATENLTTQVGINSVVSDSVTMSDVLTCAIWLLVVVNETLTISENILLASGYISTVSDLLNAADAVLLDIAGEEWEALAMTDIATIQIWVNSILQDWLTIGDNVTAIKNMYIDLVESVYLSDNVTATTGVTTDNSSMFFMF